MFKCCFFRDSSDHLKGSRKGLRLVSKPSQWFSNYSPKPHIKVSEKSFIFIESLLRFECYDGRNWYWGSSQWKCYHYERNAACYSTNLKTFLLMWTVKLMRFVELGRLYAFMPHIRKSALAAFIGCSILLFTKYFMTCQQCVRPTIQYKCKYNQYHKYGTVPPSFEDRPCLRG